MPTNRNSSKPPTSNGSKTHKTNHNTDQTFVNSNQFKNLSNSTNQQNTTNLQDLSINSPAQRTPHSHHHETTKSSIAHKGTDHETENAYTSTGKSSFITSSDNNNTNYNGNRNSGHAPINNGFNNSNAVDQNNNSLYNAHPNYFSSANDNINLNHVEKPLLGPIKPGDNGKKCLIIDLDETLVHSSFKQVNNADFIVPVEIDGIVHQVYVLKRPHVDEFLERVGKLFECVLFTASLAKYADPVADLLDKSSVLRDRLFREACVYYRGNYVKDLSRLGRDLHKVIIIDNSPASYIFHPENAVPCMSWFDDANDRELLDLIPYFERLAACDSVYSVIKQQSNTNSMSSSLNNTNSYQQQSLIYSQQQIQQSYEENQQVPGTQYQTLIYQQQQHVSTTNEAQNSPDYSLNENKILLSIDSTIAKKQQQLH